MHDFHSMSQQARLVACAGLVLVAGTVNAAAPAGAATKACTGARYCDESSSLALVVTDVRTSNQQGARYVTLNISFRNKTSRPLVLAYERGSTLVIDDQGNRYGLHSARGIPEVSRGSAVDTSFVLQPGEASDGRFEFAWSGSTIAGTVFGMDLAVRELNLLPGNQVRLGKEHAMSFKRLQPGAAGGGAAAVTAPAIGSATQSATSPPPPAGDPCNGAGTCYAAGPFVAEVLRVTTSRPSNGPVNAEIRQRVEVRFRNVSAKTIILAHNPDHATVIDNIGNRYWYWDAKANVTGIGFVWGSTIDPSFALRPGESRNAVFEQRFVYDSRQKTVGNSYTFDIQIDEIEILPSQQMRIVRKNAVGFRDLTSRGGAARVASGDAGDQGKKAVEALKGLFKKH